MLLINTKPADPSTIFSMMIEGEQMYTVFTVDQQLYAIILKVIWFSLERWKQFNPRLTGMHLLMSFIGSISKMVKDSGLKETMKFAISKS